MNHFIADIYVHVSILLEYFGYLHGKSDVYLLANTMQIYLKESFGLICKIL